MTTIPNPLRVPANASGATPAAEAPHRFTRLDGAMLAALLLTLALNTLAGYLALGWITAAVTTGIMALVLLALAAVMRAARPLILRLLLAGLVAGICELFTDFAGEQTVHSLTYPAGEPLLWASPVYMPLSWMVVLAELGYLAWRLRGLIGPWRAALICAVVGAANIPWYEEMAYHAGWWRYAAARNLGHTPAYVLLFEALVVAALPVLYHRIERRPLAQVAGLGALVGIWMPFAALGAWLALGR